MPKGSTSVRGRKRATQDYEDDGFVVTDDSAPKSKKAKKGQSAGKQQDDEGNEFWELSAKRRVTVSEFRGKSMVSIREYYEKDGKDLPGKKGISLTLDQYNALVELLPDVEAALARKGEAVKRPNFEGPTGGPVKGDQQSDNDEADDAGKQNFEATSDEQDE
ncbi:putative RNA polymerase II transcriptional protein [Botryosphaeria dothidea]|uniref:RNA polymerase II transcriptional protein n=1 Tax=Botryosphaeria dothidea TaxID=55169 RepID=A0A8H4NAU1_9PEZI|nr:putative RNA polymerase II transcriptional protein [Botryosphaeria dothidea]